MIAQKSPALASASTLLSSTGSLAARLVLLKASATAWWRTCADYYEAAALYDRLSGLSDAELCRRGLSRDTLARDVCEACRSTGTP
jgi:hypothetical protein